jgi:FtsZ-binding cell division protein ZapB
MQEEIEHLKDDIQEILDGLKAQGLEIDNLTSREKTLEHETRCAWRYRIR